MIFTTIEELGDNRPQHAPERAQENGVLMVTPDYFDVAYVTNVHSQHHVGGVNKDEAQRQWTAVKTAIEETGTPVVVLPGATGLPDQVFTANTGVVHKKANETHVLLSHMALDSRQPEVAHFRDWADQQGYVLHELSTPQVTLEGNGDVLWHPHREWIYVGYGHRTNAAGVSELAEFTGATIVQLELVDERWYHLDVALSIVRDDLALMVPQAFTPEGQALIRACFENVVEVSEHDALNFVCNGFTPDNKHFIVEQGSDDSVKALRTFGVEVVEVDTSEFMKAGGSVFCMKQEVFL